MKSLFTLAILSITFISCQKTSTTAKHTSASTPHEITGNIIFTPEQAARTTFKVQTITPKTFHQIIKVTGQIMAAPGDESVIVATCNGVISYNSTSLIEGAHFKQGRTLFQISSKNMAEGDFYSKTKANFETAKNNFTRAKKLVKDKIISQKEFEEKKLEFHNAHIAFEAIAQNKTKQGVGINTPISGYIKNILVKEGEYITAGQALATISQNKKLLLRAEVPERHYPTLKNISGANFKTPYSNRIYTLSSLNGHLLSHGKTSDKNSFYIPVTFEFDNKGDIIPGSFVEIYLISSPIENAIAIPTDALTNEMGIFYVYVQVDQEHYRKQEVTTGMNNGKEVQILKGLHPGDRVVTQGAYQLKIAATAGSIPQGHKH